MALTQMADIVLCSQLVCIVNNFHSYNCFFQSFIKCKYIDYQSTRTETFYDIQLNIKGKKNSKSSRSALTLCTYPTDNNPKNRSLLYPALQILSIVLFSAIFLSFSNVSNFYPLLSRQFRSRSAITLRRKCSTGTINTTLASTGFRMLRKASFSRNSHPSSICIWCGSSTTRLRTVQSNSTIGTSIIFE